MDLEITTQDVLVSVGLFALSTLITSLIVGAFLVLIPADHFIAPRSGLQRRIPSAPLRIAYLAGKNLLGVLLVLAGLLLSLPGVPGQGLLTILVGMVLLDIPGKRGLELRLVSRPRILRGINRLRRRFGREPVRTEPDETESAPPRTSGSSPP